MNIIESYKELASRNGWSFSIDPECKRPYFMKNGDYAIPDDKTSEEDKELLATIISEGSEELKRIILMCWENGVVITGPCSGIGEFHVKKPFALHLGIKGPEELLKPLYEKVMAKFPHFSHLLRGEDKFRYDLSYPLMDREALSKEESDAIFKEIADELAKALGLNNGMGGK